MWRLDKKGCHWPRGRRVESPDAGLYPGGWRRERESSDWTVEDSLIETKSVDATRVSVHMAP